jgi:hypothetical protein
MDSPTMQSPPLDPPVADTAPTDRVLTGYDEQHVVTYLRLLDAEKEGADWREVAKLVLHIDPVSDSARARRAWESHLARCPLDDRERLPPPAARWRTALILLFLRCRTGNARCRAYR